MDKDDKNKYDVCIVGAGIVGCALARELSKYRLKIAVLDKNSDLAEGATKANSGIVHAGYDAMPHTNKAKYNLEGQRIFAAWCKELDVHYRQNGSLVLAFSPNDLPALEKLYQRGLTNGIQNITIINQEQLQARERHLGKAAFALSVPSGAICSPYGLAIRLMEQAVINGCKLYLDNQVLNIVKDDDSFSIYTNKGKYETRTIVNAAGVHADALNNMLSEDRFTITARKGEYWMLDRTVGHTFSSTIFQLPTARGKGVLITPTVEDTMIIGPTSQDVDDKGNTATTAEGLEEVLRVAAHSWPSLPHDKFITTFSGLRAHCDRDDFIVGKSADVPGYYLACGIESPGLTAAPAIAVTLAELISEQLAALPKGELFLPPPPALFSFRESDDEKRRQLIAVDPAYARIICRCEYVTEAEIRQAIRRPAGARTVDGIKRRTRAGMGRCQSGFCLPYVLSLLAEELEQDITKITLDTTKSKIVKAKLGDYYHGCSKTGKS